MPQRRVYRRRDHHTVIVNSGHSERSFVGWHLFHLILTVLTCGLWSVVWMLHWFIWLSVK